MMAASLDNKPESGAGGDNEAAAAMGLVAGNNNSVNQVSHQPSHEGASSLFCLSLLRSACDACWRKKSRCSGEMPCERCKRAGAQCTYSTKRKLGRPKRNGRTEGSAEQRPSVAKKRKKLSHQACCLTSPSSPSFSPSPATALAGLPESKYLSSFLEHFCPMFPVTDEVSIRDGLMHCFIGLWNSSSSKLQGHEALRARALECSFFSSVAIGGLISGCPASMLSAHVDTAHAAVAEIRGLSDKHAVSAQILHGMLYILLPSPGSNAEGRRSLDEAHATFESLQHKPPLVSLVLAFDRQVESLRYMGMDTLCRSPSFAGSSPVTATASAYCRAPSFASTVVLSEGAHTEEGDAILKGVELRRDGPGGGGGQAMPVRNIHPAYVVADALLLATRFVREEGGAGSIRLRRAHDYVTSELNRLVRAKAGAMVLISLAGILLGIKTRLFLTDGVLPAAELIYTMFQRCPGWARSYGRHAAHMSMAVFRLYGRREPYDALKNDIGVANDEFIPDWEGAQQSGQVCMLECCMKLAEMLVKLKPSDANGEIIAAGSSTTLSPSPADNAAANDINPARGSYGQVESSSPGSDQGTSIINNNTTRRDDLGNVGILCAGSKRRRASLMTQQQQQQHLLAETTMPSLEKTLGHHAVDGSRRQRAMSLPSNVAPATTLGISEEALVGRHRAPSSGVRVRGSPSAQPPRDERTFAVPRPSLKQVLSADSSSKAKTTDDSTNIGRSGGSCVDSFCPCAVPNPQSHGRGEIDDVRSLGNVVGSTGFHLQSIQSNIVNDSASTASVAGASREGKQEQHLKRRQQQQAQQRQRQQLHHHQQHQQHQQPWHDSSHNQRQTARACGCDVSERTASGAGMNALPRLMDWACADCYTPNGFPWQPNHGGASAGSGLPPQVSSASLLLQGREQSHAWGGHSSMDEDDDGGGGGRGGGGERHQNGVPLPSLSHVSDQPDSGFAQQQQSLGQWQGLPSSVGLSFSPVGWGEGGGGGVGVGGSDSSKGTSRTGSQSSSRPESEFDFSELGYLLCEDGLPSSPIRSLHGGTNSPEPPRIV